MSRAGAKSGLAAVEEPARSTSAQLFLKQQAAKLLGSIASSWLARIREERYGVRGGFSRSSRVASTTLPTMLKLSGLQWSTVSLAVCQ